VLRFPSARGPNSIGAALGQDGEACTERYTGIELIYQQDDPLGIAAWIK
jgi:hypothetical protein